MLYWFPMIKDLDIPQPRTEMVELKADYWDLMGVLDGVRCESLEAQIPELVAAGEKIGTPLFMRTSHTSGKHDWSDTCFVPDLTKIKRHVGMLIQDTSLKTIPLDAFVLREYIEMDSRFIAFDDGMPVNPERRYFINNGEIQCHHPYWIPEAIAESRVLPDDWLEKLALMNIETDEEVGLLTAYAQMIAGIFPEYWSVDFCKAKDGRWILIDMATGEASWHDERCEYYAERDY